MRGGSVGELTSTLLEANDLADAIYPFTYQTTEEYSKVIIVVSGSLGVNQSSTLTITTTATRELYRELNTAVGGGNPGRTTALVAVYKDVPSGTSFSINRSSGTSTYQKHAFIGIK